MQRPLIVFRRFDKLDFVQLLFSAFSLGAAGGRSSKTIDKGLLALKFLLLSFVSSLLRFAGLVLY